MAEEPEASGGDPTTTNHAREWLSTTELLQPVHLGCFRHISHSLVPLCCVLTVHCSLELLGCVQPFLVLAAVLLQRVGCALQP